MNFLSPSKARTFFILQLIHEYNIRVMIMLLKKLNFLCFVLLLITVTSCQKNQEVEVFKIDYVDAKSAIVMETTTNRILFEQNINERLLPASITKILTAITIIDNFDLNQQILITKEMLNVEGSKIYLEIEDVISVMDLLYGLMMNSGNDAATALSIGLCGNVKNFTFLMNEKAKEIGMINSTWENPHGLDSETSNYTTAYDMALLMAYAMKNKTFRKITSCKEYCPIITSGRRLYFHNKHKLIQSHELVNGGKTGYTKKAGRTLVTSFKKDNFEIVVVTFNCSSDWLVHTRLAENVFETFKMKQVLSTFGAHYSLLPYGDYNITSSDLMFPLANWENKKNISTVIYLNLDKDIIEIHYLTSEKLLGKCSLSNRKKK